LKGLALLTPPFEHAGTNPFDVQAMERPSEATGSKMERLALDAVAEPQIRGGVGEVT
jgi:hypothetical protein